MPRIDEMFAFVATDENGDEGIMAALMGNTFMPLIGGDMERIESLRPLAREAALSGGRTYRILKFTHREDITDG